MNTIVLMAPLQDSERMRVGFMGAGPTKWKKHTT